MIPLRRTSWPRQGERYMAEVYWRKALETDMPIPKPGPRFEWLRTPNRRKRKKAPDNDLEAHLLLLVACTAVLTARAAQRPNRQTEEADRHARTTDRSTGARNRQDQEGRSATEERSERLARQIAHRTPACSKAQEHEARLLPASSPHGPHGDSLGRAHSTARRSSMPRWCARRTATTATKTTSPTFFASEFRRHRSKIANLRQVPPCGPRSAAQSAT